MDNISNPSSATMLRSYPQGSLAEYLRSQNHLLARGQKPSATPNPSSTKSIEHNEPLTKKKRRHRRARRNGTVTLYIDVSNNSHQELEEPTGTPCLVDATAPSAQEEAIDMPAVSLLPVTSYPGMFELGSKLQSIVPVNLLIDHYLQTMAVPIPVLDQDGYGLLRSKWFPMAASEPAPLLSILLASAAHFISGDWEYATTPNKSLIKSENPERVSALLSLKQLALQHTNMLLNQPSMERRTSDTAVAAVAKMASYEAIYGDIKAYRTHMYGLSCMLADRGSIDCLSNALDGLLQRMVMWIDTNCAFLLRETPWFEGIFSFPPLATNLWSADPDMEHFLAAR